MRPSPFLIGLLTLIFSSVSTAYALIGLNQCGPGTNPPAGMRCGREELLLGYRDAAGPCVWVCCPPNGDGQTYNCSADPRPSEFRLDLRSVHPTEWKGVFTPGPSHERAD